MTDYRSRAVCESVSLKILAGAANGLAGLTSRTSTTDDPLVSGDNSMKLLRARVRNYRSVVDSGIVDFEERVTVLIGKNEQGKTTFQKGLLSINEGISYTPKDLPNHMRVQLETISADQIPIIDGWFSLSEADREELATLFSQYNSPVTSIHVTKYYDSHYDYGVTLDDPALEHRLTPKPPDIDMQVRELKRDVETLRTKLRTQAERLATFAPGVEQAAPHMDAFLGANFADHDQIANLVKTFITTLKALPGQDAAIQEDITEASSAMSKALLVIQQAVKQDFYAPLRAALPKFIFHSTAIDRIPDFVPITDFIAKPETYSRGMANLCAVAGLTMQKVQQLAAITEAADRETFEDTYRGTISGGINEFWTQENYTVHFRFETTRLSVSISDGTYTQRIAPSDRSDGFQWYLSFYAALLSEVSSTESLVILLDNPGLELHADGQRDIKRFLEQKLAAPAQVIYVTHSSAMIDVFNLEQIRQVELLGQLQGTKVGRLRVKEGTEFDLLEPVRSAIGASLAASLIFNEFNILVEGAADKPLLEGAFALLRPVDARRMLVNGSISESSGLLPRFYQRAKLPFVTLLDADSGGRELRTALLGWGVVAAQIVDLNSLFEGRTGDFELEDVLSTQFYHSAVVAAYPEQPVEPPPATHVGKRTRYYEAQFRQQHKIGFNKRRVADNAKRLLQTGTVDDDTRHSLTSITDAIWNALENLVTPH